jgi:hypothetical protein
MLNDYPVLTMCLIVGAIIGFLVLGYFVSNKKLKSPFARPAEAIYTIISAAFFLLIVGSVVYAAIDEITEKSGWIPRTRDVLVYVKAQTWVTGEIKTCASFASQEKKEIGALVCDQDDRLLDEHHVLQVKFWGPITTDRNKEWKCVREQASLTCKLQSSLALVHPL